MSVHKLHCVLYIVSYIVQFVGKLFKLTFGYSVIRRRPFLLCVITAVRPRSLDRFYVVTYYIKGIKTPWAHREKNEQDFLDIY